MTRFQGLRLAFIGAGIVVAILTMRDTAITALNGDNGLPGAGAGLLRDILREGWGLLAGAIVSLVGLYYFVKARTDT